MSIYHFQILCPSAQIFPRMEIPQRRKGVANEGTWSWTFAEINRVRKRNLLFLWLPELEKDRERVSSRIRKAGGKTDIAAIAVTSTTIYTPWMICWTTYTPTPPSQIRNTRIYIWRGTPVKILSPKFDSQNFDVPINLIKKISLIEVFCQILTPYLFPNMPSSSASFSH